MDLFHLFYSLTKPQIGFPWTSEYLGFDKSECTIFRQSYFVALFLILTKGTLNIALILFQFRGVGLVGIPDDQSPHGTMVVSINHHVTEPDQQQG